MVLLGASFLDSFEATEQPEDKELGVVPGETKHLVCCRLVVACGESCLAQRRCEPGVDYGSFGAFSCIAATFVEPLDLYEGAAGSCSQPGQVR